VLTRNCDKDRVLHFEVQQNGWGERLKATVVVGEVVVEVRPVVMASLKMGELARVALRDCIQLFLKTFENSAHTPGPFVTLREVQFNWTMVPLGSQTLVFVGAFL
jgi:hypothetical protein